jgi:uncharacterized membrane protein
MKYANPKRSFAKSITWRICATLTTVLLVWIFIGKLSIAFSVGIVEVIVKLGIYYFHERAWNQVKWGLYKTTPGMPIGLPREAPCSVKKIVCPNPGI